ncbi:TonB dependent receptor [compost metagenome]
MKNKWIRQLACAGPMLSLCVVSNNLWAVEKSMNPEKRMFEQQTQSVNIGRSMKVADILKNVSKKEHVYFAYANKQIDKITIAGVDPLVLKLDNLPKILAKANLNLVKVSDNQYIIEEISKVRNRGDQQKSQDSEQNTVVNQEFISGFVRDTNGNPLSGVTVKVQKGTATVRTDDEGKFSIEATVGNTLQFNLIGYESKSLEIRSSDPIHVQLAIGITNLEEVVVVGYGTQKKGDLTGAIGTVNVEKQFKGRAVTNVQELLAGSIPGLNIRKTSGAVGSGASINIRGTQTMGTSSGVLVIIDGMVGNINTLNPNDIESVSILKDAASASIYGARAANGVMLVTTKSGKVGDGKPVVEFNESIGIQKPQFQLKFVGAADYMRLKDEQLRNDGQTSGFYGEEGQRRLANGELPDNDWYKLIYKNTSAISNNNVAISGRSDYITYRLSTSYDYQDGTLPQNNYNRYIFKPSMTIRLSDKLNIASNLQYTNTYILEPNGGTQGFQSQAIRNSPVVPVRTPGGQYFNTGSIGGNPLAAINEGGHRRDQFKELLGNITINYSPIKNLNFQGLFARAQMDQHRRDRTLSYQLFNVDETVGLRANALTSQREYQFSNYRNTLQATGEYSYKTGKHDFKAMAGYSYEYYNNSNFQGYRENMPFNDINVLGTGGSVNQQANGGAFDYSFLSYFGRLNYSYDNRYLLQTTVRADGSSYFGPGNKWGYYPTVSAGWNVHNESFFNVDKISQLKLRASYGEAGDAQKQLDPNNPNYYPYAVILSYDPAIYGFNGGAVSGAYQGLAVDPNIVWEVSRQTNLGLDIGLFKQKLVFSVDYFDNERDRILYRSTAPAEFGLAGPLTNGAVLKNRGWDISGSYNDTKNDFSWGVGFVLNWSKTEVVNRGTNPLIVGDRISTIGDQFDLMYGLESMGLFQSAEEIAAAPSQGTNILPGNIRYRDISGPDGIPDGVINGLDRTVLNRKIPLIYGLNFNFGWKNFDISANLNGRHNNVMYLSGYSVVPFNLTDNVPVIGMDAWSPENTDGTAPRLSSSNTANDTRFSSFWLRKANYMKIQNAQIGYTFSNQLLDKIKIKSARIFISGQNLATISSINFDPEADLGYYPLSRTYSFGINARF